MVRTMKKDTRISEMIERKRGGMERRDFLKLAGFFSAAFLIVGIPLARKVESAARIAETQPEATYYVSGWCIPH
jgi:hypothetical protein